MVGLVPALCGLPETQVGKTDRKYFGKTAEEIGHLGKGTTDYGSNNLDDQAGKKENRLWRRDRSFSGRRGRNPFFLGKAGTVATGLLHRVTWMP